MTIVSNFKMYRNKFQLLVNWVGDRFDWQFFENVIVAPNVLNQYYNKYFLVIFGLLKVNVFILY